MGQLSDYLPTLADWTPLFVAEELAELGDTMGVRQRLERLPAGSAARERWAWLPRARALEVAESPGDAVPIAEAAVAAAPDDRTRSLALLRLGELALAAGDSSRAREALTEAATSDRGGRWATDAVDVLARLPHLDAKARYTIARTKVTQGEWRGSVDGLEAGVTLDSLDPEERAQARLDLVRAYFSTRRYGDAERGAVELLGDSTAGAPIQARALYFEGRARYRQGQREAGRATLESVADRFPDARAARDALYLLAELDDDAGRVASAQAYYRRILDVAPRTTTADVAGMRLGGMAYADAHLAEAAQIYDRRRREAGRLGSRQQAAYWSGLVYEALNEPDSARARFEEVYQADPLSYYGSEAARRLGAPLLAEELAAGPIGNGRALDAELANAVARLRVHMKVPTPGSFAYELGRLTAYFKDGAGGGYALAEALIDGGLPIQGILLGRELQRDQQGWDVRLMRIVYPFPHRELIVREAARLEVNPFLAAGLIRQESMFDEDIESRAGAIGMMQVMPATGRELASRLGITPFSARRLTEAEVNVRLGMTFLENMLQRYDGELVDVLVAYNAGPTRIRRWRNMPEYSDRDFFMERIPFRETREYVKVVQKNALIYTSLYGCGSGEPCLGAPPVPVNGLVGSPHDAQASLR
jgi:soluble lytic murein transglycosylase